MVFESSVLTYQAAAEGLGVAMGQVLLLKDEIASGRLVPLFDRPIRRDLGLYAVWPLDRPSSRKLDLFLAWLEAEAGHAASPRLPARAHSERPGRSLRRDEGAAALGERRKACSPGTVSSSL